jgi:catechol 2,3-dioxygenase-like lactoylglutathione lyase family enzyme
MKNKFLGLRTLGYKVPDLAAATEWYTKILGIKPYFNQPFYVGFNVAGYELGLQPEEGSSSRSDNAVTYWGVENASDTYKFLIDAGATAHSEPADVGDGIIVASVNDPWGNIFGIIYNPHFKSE